MRTFVVACAALLLACSASARGEQRAWPGVPVLMYHRVDAVVPSDPVGRDLTVAPATFTAQLRWLRAHGIRTMTAAQLVAALTRGERPTRAVVLTFDDGYADAATEVFPRLRDARSTATFFVSSGFVGTPRHVAWRQLRAMRRAGLEVACHGTFHLDLSALDHAGQKHEAQHCIATMARYLGGFAGATYAYPAGKYNATTFAVLNALHVGAAFTERPGLVYDLSRRYELPRRRIHRDDSLATFGALATP